MQNETAIKCLHVYQYMFILSILRVEHSVDDRL